MSNHIRILYVEDDATLAFVTRDNLERAGYQIDACEDGVSALEKINTGTYDIYILDVMLPKIDGFTLARRIREKTESAPIIFLSARSTPDDKISGLQLGADDYITKPFSIEELILKIEIFMKRAKIDPAHLQKQVELQLGIYTFIPAELTVSHPDGEFSLTQKESELLEYLCTHQGKVLKRDDILEKVWGNSRFFSSRSLDVFVSRLRKLLNGDNRVKIENIHNIGYRFIIKS
jgi:DNA-binding response OmpR family regulator